MTTIDDLRTALHAEAAATPSLSSAEVLRHGRRIRARRQMLAAGGAAAAVVAVVAVVAVAPWRPGPVEVPNLGAPAPTASAYNPWVLGTPVRSEPGKHTMLLDDPTMSGVLMTVYPGIKGQPGLDRRTGPADLVVDGLSVAVTEEAGNKGRPVFRLEWFARNARYELVVPGEGITEEDLKELVIRVNARFED